MIKKVILALSLLLAAAAPAAAQFADQATYAGAGGGTANAQTLTLANASAYADLVGVIVKYTPSATNTGAATLTVNGFGSSPAFRKPNGAGVTALAGGELVSGQPTLIMYDGTFFNLMAPVALPIGAAQLQNSALSYGVPTNLGISATVATNALTISLKGADGNAPSGTNPILVPFRDVTIATGNPSVVSITAPLSFTIASTSTMGCVNSQMCRLWIVLVNNGGTAVLGAFNALSGTNISPINEAALQTCESGTSGGSSAQKYYCSTSAVTAKAIKIIGYIDIQEVTAGTWATGPTYVQLFGPGIKKPGDIVQRIFASNTATATNSNNYVYSNTAPVPANGGTAVAAPALTPTSQANVISVAGQASIGSSGGARMVVYVSNGTATLTTSAALSSSGEMITLPVRYQTPALSLTPVTFTLYYSGQVTNSFLNSQAGSAQFGGTASTFIEVLEIMGALSEPANDDGNSNARMVG